MNEIFADLHVHIGRSENGKPIKITGARSLNFANIAKECYERKGIDDGGSSKRRAIKVPTGSN